MPRRVKEWIGKTPDSQPPPKVKLRNFDEHGGRCHICTGKIMVGDPWETDHKIRIKDGGENRESNLRPAHKRCHAGKTADENRQQAIEDRKRKKHLGIKSAPKRPLKGKGFAKTERQRPASAPLRKKFEGDII